MPRDPQRRARTRPVELVLFSAGIAIFVGLVVLISTREWTDPRGPVATLIFTGAAFIVALVMFAMFSLAEKPNPEPDPDALIDDPAASSRPAQAAEEAEHIEPAPGARQDGSST